MSIFAPIFPQIIMKIINHNSKRCQGEIESVGYAPEAVQGAQRSGNCVDISLWVLMGKEKNFEILDKTTIVVYINNDRCRYRKEIEWR